MFKPTFFLLIHKMNGASSSEITVHQKAAQAAKLPMFIFSGYVYSTATAESLFFLNDLITT